MKARIGLVIGSGFGRLALEVRARTPVTTPFGEPSSGVMTARIGGVEVLAIARHGGERAIAPDAVNYRANIWALRELGVEQCIAVNVVGAIDPAFLPGELAVPDQIIDYTWGRESSFGGEGPGSRHIEFTEPFDAVLRGRLAAALEASGNAVRAGVYGVTQGPRLETAAEIDRLERDGCTMVGMTAMPEAALAREAGIAYAICAAAVNHAAGRSPAAVPIRRELERFLDAGMNRAAAVLELLIPVLGRPTM